MDYSTKLVDSLHKTLQSLSAHSYPFVAGPDTLKKRASVALIVRVQPHYSNWPPTNDTATGDLDSFFQQDWVQHGDPEVLFIKRAARKGDRWTSHVALPGGRRDPGDADDLAAAIRETSEEVGIDLSEHAIQVGNLPQRVVTTHWGKVPLMVLCPYIFLVTQHALPPLKLQPTEVASTHWVPIRALLSAEQRTVSLEDVSNRLANQETGVKRWMLRAMVGQMIFAAIRLLPSETVNCAASRADSEPVSKPDSWSSRISSLWDPRRQIAPAPHEQPLLLWGLTLGVLADFLDLLPPHNALTLWTYPTFTPWDVRFTIWAMSYAFKKRKIQEIQSGRIPKRPAVAVELGLGTVSMPSQERMNEVGLHGLGSGVDNEPSRMELKSSAVGTMLEGYYDIVRRAVAVALIGRSSMIVAVVAWLYLRYRRRNAL